MNMMRYLFFIALVFVSYILVAQNSDDVLFSVEGNDVLVSEFQYIYNKNNRDGADYSESSLREYLDLYMKFKLKVEKAREMKLDTIVKLQQELAGYRKQLANSYLTDKEVKAKLVQEAYNRIMEDVHVSHIMVSLAERATTAEVEAAQAKITKAYDRLMKGESFSKVAAEMSEDPNTKNIGGDAGFMNAMFPSGFYAFETAAYETSVGEISKPVRTSIGFHIVKVLEKRPARGKIDASHLLVRVNKDGSNEASTKSKIDGLAKQLKEGAGFEDLARKYSEDKETSKRGGFLGTIGINTFEKAFEDAAFGMKEVGSVSQPVRTRLGWHLIKLMDIKPAGTFQASKRRLEAMVSKNERIEAAQKSMVREIKKSAGYKVEKDVYDQFVTAVDGDLFSYKWTPPTVREKQLFSFGDEMQFTNTDFGAFLRGNARSRLRMPRSSTKEELMESLFNEFVDTKAIEYEEGNLDEKYPAFKALMREYEEGILLFEATKINVWDKASNDTVGLKKFFDEHRDDYMWDSRAKVVTYTTNAGDIKAIAKLRKLAMKKSPEQIIAKMNKKSSVVRYQEKLYTQTEKEKGMQGLEWMKGSVSKDVPDTVKNLLSYSIVQDILPPARKNMNEARGYIIADYQDYLEKEWVRSLKDKYKVVTNEDVLKSLIQN